MSTTTYLTDRGLLRLHLEAVWSISLSLPRLEGASVELPATRPLPPWSLYQAQLARERVTIWRPMLSAEARADLLQRAQSAADVFDPTIGMRREVVLRPPAMPQRVDVPPDATVRLLDGAASEDAALLEAFEWGSASYFLDAQRGPCVGVIVAGRLVSVAHSSRRTGEACELGINTLLDARRRGYARLATRMWTRMIHREGLVPLYSAFAHNSASLRLAAATGYVQCCEGVYGPFTATSG